MVIDESKAGQEVNVSAGQNLVINLQSDQSDGYSWGILSITDSDVIKNTGNEFFGGASAGTPVAGAPGTEVWTFNAQAKGGSTITMGYYQANAAGMRLEKTFTVTAVVN